MNILVLIKGVMIPTKEPVLDEEGQLDATKSTVVLNPRDENAIEAALQLTGTKGGNVTVASYGTPDVAETALRAGLALGATKAVMIDSPLLPATTSDERTLGVVLAEAIKKLGTFDVILTGSYAVDTAQGCMGAVVANSLKLPYLDNVNVLAVNNDQLSYTMLWEKDKLNGEVQMPAVIAVTDTINKPRLPSFKTKMMAKRAVLDHVQVDAITVMDQNDWEQLNGQRPANRLAPMPVQQKEPVIYNINDDDTAVMKLVRELQTQGVM